MHWLPLLLRSRLYLLFDLEPRSNQQSIQCHLHQTCHLLDLKTVITCLQHHFWRTQCVWKLHLFKYRQNKCECKSPTKLTTKTITHKYDFGLPDVPASDAPDLTRMFPLTPLGPDGEDSRDVVPDEPSWLKPLETRTDPPGPTIAALFVTKVEKYIR